MQDALTTPIKPHANTHSHTHTQSPLPLQEDPKERVTAVGNLFSTSLPTEYDFPEEINPYRMGFRKLLISGFETVGQSVGPGNRLPLLAALVLQNISEAAISSFLGPVDPVKSPYFVHLDAHQNGDNFNNTDTETDMAYIQNDNRDGTAPVPTKNRKHGKRSDVDINNPGTGCSESPSGLNFEGPLAVVQILETLAIWPKAESSSTACSTANESIGVLESALRGHTVSVSHSEVPLTYLLTYVLREYLMNTH